MKKLLIVFTFLAFTLSTFAQTVLGKGDNCFDKGDYVCAKTKYQEAIGTTTGRDKQIAEIKYSRAQTCEDWLTVADKAYNNENYQEAKEKYQLILNENPKDSYAASQIEKSDKAIEAAITLTIPNDNINLSPFGGSKRIIVNTNAESYTVSQYPTWCTIETHSDYFVISFEANISKNTRMGGFKVMAGKKEVNGSVTQPPQSKIETTLSVSKKYITIDAKKKTVIIDVNTNSSDYEITKLPSWCRVTSKYDTWFLLECDKNYFPSSRSAKLSIVAGDKKVKVNLKQLGTRVSESSTITSSYKPKTSRYKYFAIGYEGGEIAYYGLRIEFGGQKLIGMFLNVRSTLLSDEEIWQNYELLENKNEAVIGFNFRIFRLLYFNLGGGYGYYKIPDVNENLEQVDYFPVYGGLTFRLGRRFNLSVGASFSDIEQTFDSSNFDPEYTLGLTINLLR